MVLSRSHSLTWLALSAWLAGAAWACGSSDSHRHAPGQAGAGQGGEGGGIGRDAAGAAGASGARVDAGAGGAQAGAGGAAVSAVSGAGGAAAGAAGASDTAGAGGALVEGCSALHFGADGDGVIVPSSPSMDFGASGTMELWLYADEGDAGSVPAAGVLLNKWVNFQEDKYFSVNSAGAVVVFFHTSGGSGQFTSAPAVVPSKWTHIAAVYDTTSMRAYVDGVKVGELAGAILPANSTGDVQIGHVVRDTAQSAFHGFYSEIRLSKVARYTADFTPEAHLTADADTTALWKLDEGTGSTAADASANDNQGNITGAAWLLAPCR